MQQVLWEPSEKLKESCVLKQYLRELQSKDCLHFTDYRSLHRWSIEDRDSFWRSIIRFFRISYSGKIHPTKVGEDFFDTEWFPNLELNFAENLLRHAYCEEGKKKVALNFVHETGLQKKINYGQLKEHVHKVQAFLRDHIQSGDVVATYTPNIPEAVTSMLAASSMGAIYTAVSSEFGVEATIERLGQVKPKVLLAAVRYTYKGKEIDQSASIREIQSRLPSVKKVILVDFLSDAAPQCWTDCISWKSIVNGPKPLGALKFTRSAFNTPLYILYSSGTTGKPKCIVHGLGGTLLGHLKELGLHCNLSANSKLLFYTSSSWMMWNWAVSSLALGGELILYDGAPTYPTQTKLWDVALQEGVTCLGLSPRYLRLLESEKEQIKACGPKLQTLLSTGAPLTPEQYDFVYKYLGKDLQFSSISGGTDILGCFISGNPMLPVYRGYMQCIALGLDVVSYCDTGKVVTDQEGELVCRKPFPNQPLYFWNDERKALYREAYFKRFPGVWHHGDFIYISSVYAIRITGRSDATLNPGGVRIGTSEVYQQTEKINFVDDALCVGRKSGEEEFVYLFLKLKQGENLSPERIEAIKEQLKVNISPRHVPCEIYSVSDIPYTHTGKKMELVVAELLRGRMPKNLQAVSNPSCLIEFPKLLLSSVEQRQATE